jgi:hypothetical protein
MRVNLILLHILLGCPKQDEMMNEAGNAHARDWKTRQLHTEERFVAQSLKKTYGLMDQKISIVFNRACHSFLC